MKVRKAWCYHGDYRVIIVVLCDNKKTNDASANGIGKNVSDMAFRYSEDNHL